VSRGVDVVFFGSVGGPDWVAEMLRNESAILWKPIAEGSFAASELKDAHGGILVVDSYLFGEAQSEQLAGLGVRIVQFWDGPWQALIGPTVVAPILDLSSALSEMPKDKTLQILGGPEFIMIRPEIKKVFQRRAARNVNSVFRIVVLIGGGSDPNHIGWVVRAIRKVDFPCEVDIFTALPDEQISTSSDFGPQIHFHAPGPQILPYLEEASLAISALGTAAMELIYLGIPSIFIPVATNQAENSRGISVHKLGKVIRPDDSDREKQLVGEILRQRELFRTGRAGFCERQRENLLVDGKGSTRIAEAVLSLGLSQ